MNSRISIAEELLGCALAPGGFAPCPGKARHTKGSGSRDFRVVFDGAPTGFCFHASCGDEVAAFNKELRRRIWFAEHPGGHGTNAGASYQRAKEWGVAAEPTAEMKARPELDAEQVRKFTQGVPEIGEGFLRRRSPVAVEGLEAGAFLDTLYGEGERILVFTDQRSQGDFIWWRGRGGYRLSQTQNVKAVPSRLPSGAPEGVWFLVQPVTGQWAINPNSVKGGGEAKWSRRSEANVTAWRYFVLESDELPPAEWLKVVVNLGMPIAAIYTSGKRSIHALLKIEVATKALWDAARNALRQFVCPLGADPAALTAVRLSRLPGCQRGEQMQKLLYLDPSPGYEPIWLKPEVRA